jgi:hypothetical protein
VGNVLKINVDPHSEISDMGLIFIFISCRKGLICRIKNCRQCTAPPCGVCSNCLHPEYKNKCTERYGFCCVGTNFN